MSRVAKKPIDLPQGVTVSLRDGEVTLKGAKGAMSVKFGNGVQVSQDGKQLRLAYDGDSGMAAGSARAHIANVIEGVTKGYERKLELVGVGFRAAVQGKVLNLTLGFSHPVNYPVPEGITIETPSQTEIVVRGVDKQKVGQVAAEIREIRPPEPYKGKGVRYSGEKIELKEGKKK
jgi:large subunit ribosomal protein L6